MSMEHRHEPGMGYMHREQARTKRMATEEMLTWLAVNSRCMSTVLSAALSSLPTASIAAPPLLSSALLS